VLIEVDLPTLDMPTIINKSVGYFEKFGNISTMEKDFGSTIETRKEIGEVSKEVEVD